MTSTSKPRHGDPIAIITVDSLTGKQTVAVPTRQFQQFLDELETSTTTIQETITEKVNDNSVTNTLLALTKKIQDQVGSGEFLTSDTDSLTVDSDVLYVDMTEA